MPQKRVTELPPINTISGPIGDNISKLRKEKGFTQEQLADQIGITQTLVSRYELGKLQLSSEMVIRFALALKVSADEILGLDNDTIPENSPSLRIMRRLRKIEELSESDQKALLKTIDKFIE